MKRLEGMDCRFPSTVAEALELQKDPATRGRPLAGGTDLIVQWQIGALPKTERAISLQGLDALRALTMDGDRLVIGALTTHAELRRSSLVQEHCPALALAAATVGGGQIQARGTVGGNVANASPAGDLPPALWITGGSVVVASTRGEREIPLGRFARGYRDLDLEPDELILRFLLPRKGEGEREGFRKLGPRKAQAISKVMAAFRGRVSDGEVRSFAVAFGSVAPTVRRLEAFEGWVVGRRVDEAFLQEAEQRASDEVAPIADIRSTAEYRRWVTGRIVRSFLEELAAAP